MKQNVIPSWDGGIACFSCTNMPAMAPGPELRYLYEHLKYNIN